MASCEELYSVLNTKWEKAVYMIVNVTVIFVATVFNVTVITLILMRATLHQPSLVLIAALACSDLAMASVAGTLYVVITMMDGSENCRLEIATCCVTSAIASTTVLLLCCITHDRYLCIRDCRKVVSPRTKTQVAVQAVVCTLVAFSLSSLFYLETIYELPVRAVEILSILMFGCFAYIVIYYMMLSKSLRVEQRPELRANRSETHRGRRAPSFRSNLNISIAMLVVSYAVSYFPATIIFMVQIFSYRMHAKPNKIGAVAFVWCSTFGYINAMLDPIIYAYRSDAIGRELRQVFSSPFASFFILPIES